MAETGEPCARRCCACAHFRVLDDWPRCLGEWFGVCSRQIDDEFGALVRPETLLDFAYTYGRHGEDDCENPSEWFKGW